MERMMHKSAMDSPIRRQNKPVSSSAILLLEIPSATYVNLLSIQVVCSISNFTYRSPSSQS